MQALDVSNIYPSLQRAMAENLTPRKTIALDRLKVLDALQLALHPADRQKIKKKLLFICTHNSRRSHLCQVWAQTWAFAAGITDLLCFSGGTEVTEVNRYVLEALAADGFKIESHGNTHDVYFSDFAPPIRCFSKRIDAPENPQQHFIAVMTCNEADAACPTVLGATHRFALPYRDPKIADRANEPLKTYLERSREIAGELYNVFNAYYG
jgi:arsenate reductase